MKANANINFIVEAMEEVIMTKWKGILLREIPKNMMHTNLTMSSNTTNVGGIFLPCLTLS